MVVYYRDQRCVDNRLSLPGRQFKEAGRLAAESKALVAKLDEERSEVNGTRAQLDDLNGELSELSEKLTRQRQEMEEEEKNEGKRLLVKIVEHLCKGHRRGTSKYYP